MRKKKPNLNSSGGDYQAWLLNFKKGNKFKLYMKITLFTLGALLCFLGVNAQSFTIGNGSVSTCNGYFYDSGSSAGDYKPNEDLIYTVKNPIGQGEFSVEFLEFALGDGDWLSVYEGQVDESSLIDIYDKNNLFKTKLSTTSVMSTMN